MKKIILPALALAMAFGVNAQDIPERTADRPGMMERKRHHKGGEAFKSLNLTEEQKAKFKTQNESFRKKMAEAKKNENITVKEWKANMENLRKEHKENTQKILTTDQKAQLEKLKQGHRPGRDGMRKKQEPNKSI